MKLSNFLEHIPDHDLLINIGLDDHHDQPENVEVANTSLVVPPLPGGPGVWLITIPDEAGVVMFSFRSIRTVAEGSGKAGVTGLAMGFSTYTTTMSIGGDSSITRTAYNAVYSKPSGALNLSHKIFSSTGLGISLTEAYLTGTSPRYLRTEWTNYTAGNLTLNCWGEVAVIG
jgi:hypothetical protein